MKLSTTIESHVQKIFGCSHLEASILNRGEGLTTKGSLALAFKIQKQSAKHRGIEWQLSFPEWVAIWINSGQINNRGRYSGQYVMSRIGDVGPYAVNNVRIKTCNENCVEAITKVNIRRTKRADR